jgi:serine/threonine protein kinase
LALILNHQVTFIINNNYILDDAEYNQVEIPQYTPIRVIGNGAFGYVFEAFDTKNNRRVAIKRT